MTDSTVDVTTMPQAQRDMIIGTYMLIRNGTSYVMLLPGLYWYPEYEIDLGGYLDEPPDDIEKLRIAGQGGAAGGLYARQEVSGTVLVNSSSGVLSYSVASAMKQVQWSGGGAVAADGTEGNQTLTYVKDIPAGLLMVPAGTAVILRSPNGVPPPGVEPGGGGSDAGAPASDGSAPGGEGGPGVIPGSDDGSVASADAGSGGGTADGPNASEGGATKGASGGGSGGCGCRAASTGGRGPSLLAALSTLAVVFSRRRVFQRRRR
jgi:MYXO-CTERM domain-containing protein